MRRICLLLAAIVLAAWPAARPSAAFAEEPPHAYHRLDRVGAALAKDPLFVDPDVSAALGGPDRARLHAAIGRTAKLIGTPVYVVVIPNPSESESQGRDRAFLHMLHDRSGRDGLYLMVNGRGYLESVAFRVPRRLPYSSLDEDDPGGYEPADPERPFTGLADRISQRLDGYATAPTASPETPELYSTPDPFGKENELTPADPEIQAPLLTGLLLAGPAGAAVLYWLGIGVLALLGRRREGTEVRRRSWASRTPSMRRLRREAAKEVARLNRLLAATDEGRGRRYAVSAYDAAQILYDDAKDDQDKAIDLVGAIVLARQGRLALDRDLASPPSPCLVNPLHGESALRKRVRKLEEHGLPRECPLCRNCHEFDKRYGLGEQHLLKIPGPDGRRPHTLVPGVWQDTAWGSRGKNFLPRVMRYLGVD
ncbi:hypothetical protein K8Z49_07480 [Actinomadura madurae]|uniref:TPM domain-containing protein n=1 Tax=Actinomadura madurae TaxID=1993 RepID=A0A1I5UVY2_9ACTN|nr:hypothetical protein [Actinomadura madurae]SFP99370.1 hypothetical protein SAMN04489713_120118 [Actinomadura madurae]SPT64626.1 Uncharacterised protein [Actinomadura madurae]